MAGERKFMGLRGNRLHAAIWIEACVCIMIFGYNQASAGNVVVLPSFYSKFPEMNTDTTTGATKAHNATIQGTVVATYTLLGVFGAFACTFLGDWMGRRWTIWLSCLVQAIGCLLMGTAFQFSQFIVARVILGLGTGGLIATVSVWQSETAKAESRGSHVSSFGIFCGLGLIFCLWIEFGCSFIGSSASWRFPLMFPILFSAIVMAFIFHLPESPRWLVKMGRVEEATEVMAVIFDTEVHSEEVKKEIREMQLSMELNGSVSLWSMFSMGRQRIFHRVCLAAIIQMYLQMTGTNASSPTAVIYYSTTLFENELHFTSTLSYVLAGCLQFTLIVGSLICAYTVDRFGRRPLLLISACLTSTAMAALTGLTSNPHNTAALKAGTFFIFWFETCYCLGFLGIPFLYASEIAPVHLRAAVCGISTAISWLFNFLVVEVTPIGFTSIGYKFFLIFMCTNFAAGVTVFFFYPETAGRSLEEIDEIFVQSHNIFDPVRVARRLPRQRLAVFLAEQKGKEGEITEQRIENLSLSSHGAAERGGSVDVEKNDGE